MAVQGNFFLTAQLSGDLGNFFQSTSVFWKPKEQSLPTEAKKLCYLLRESLEAKTQPQIAQICLNFLSGIAQFKENQNVIRELGLLEELIPVLQNPNEQMALPAFCAYAELIADNPQNQTILFSAKNFIDIIIQSILKANDIIKEMSLRIIMNLSLNQDIRGALVKKNNLLENIAKVIPPAASKQNSVAIGYALSTISNFSMIKDQIVSNHMLSLKPCVVLQVLGDYLSSPILNYREYSMQSIQYLTEFNVRWRNAVINGVDQVKGIFDVIISQLQSNNTNIVKRILRVLISISISFEAESNPSSGAIDVLEQQKLDPNFENPETTNQHTMRAITIFMNYKKHILSLLFKILPTKGNPNNETYISYLPSVLKLLTVLSSSPELMNTFRELDGLKIYTSMLFFYTSLPNPSQEIAIHIVHTLNNLLYDDQNLNYFIEKGGIQQFIDALSDQSNSDYTISEIARIIANICVSFEEARSQILASNVTIQKFTKLLTLKEKPTLQEQSLRALTNLSLSVTSLESAKYMIESNTLSLISNFITQTPIQTFEAPNAVNSKQYISYILAFKYFINLSANMAIQPHVMKCFGGIEYFINLLKFFQPSRINRDLLSRLIDLPLNIIKLLSNLTVKGRVRKYIHETSGVLDLINSFSSIPQLTEQLEILSANLKFPYEKFYAEEDDTDKALPEIVKLDDEDEDSDSDEESNRNIVDNANELQKQEEYRKAQELQLQLEQQARLEEERLLREEEEERKRIEEEKRAIAELNRIKQQEFEKQQKILAQEKERLRVLQEQQRLKREKELSDQRKKEEEVLEKLLAEQEKLKQEKLLEEKARKEQQLQSDLKSKGLEIEKLTAKIKQRAAKIEDKKSKLIATEEKCKKLESKTNTRNKRLQRTSMNANKSQGRTRSSTTSAADHDSRKSMPSPVALDDTFKRNNNNNNGDVNQGILDKLAAAEQKFQRAEKSYTKAFNKIQSLKASIAFLINRFNAFVDERNTLIQNFIQWKLENQIIVKEEYETIEKMVEIYGDITQGDIKIKKEKSDDKKDKEYQERKALEEKEEKANQEKELQARLLREAKEKELQDRIEQEKQRIESERSLRAKDDVDEEATRLAQETKKREEVLELEKKNLEAEIAKKQKEAEDSEKNHLLQREKRRKAIEDAKMRYSQQVETVQSKELELKTASPSTIPKAVDEAEQRKKLAIKRTNISREIYDTEKSYVDSLSVLVNKFQRPLMQQAEYDALLEEPTLLCLMQVKTIFGCVEVIMNFNNILLEGLEQRLKNWHENQCLGDIFITLTDYLRCYVQYVNNYNNAMTELAKAKANNSSFQKFIAKAERARECKNLSMESFLIMPIQRVPRYVLLLTDLLRNTPNEHPDYKNLSEALEKMKETGVIINERKREAESISKLYEVYAAMGGKVDDLIQPSRRFVTEGLCKYAKKENASRWKKGYLHLFNDLLLVSKPSKHLQSFEFKMKFSLLGIHMAGLDDTKKISNAFKIMGSSSEEAKDKIEVSVAYKTPSDRDFWFNSIHSQNDGVLSRRYSFTRNSFRGRPVF